MPDVPNFFLWLHQKKTAFPQLPNDLPKLRIAIFYKNLHLPSYLSSGQGGVLPDDIKRAAPLS
jgi:hypothetical protein